MRCPGCATELLAAAKFCHECGQATDLAALPLATAPGGAERRQLTVLFCDVVGSTALAAGLDAEDWREILRHYQSCCSQVIERYEGYVAQYLGDGLLVYFGYPAAHENEAERAVRAGLEMVDAVRDGNTELEATYALRLSVRVGIHTGPVVVGEMGGAGHHETLALGDTTNIAARLQEVAESDCVVLSDATLRLTRGQLVTRDLGLRSLKGVGELRVHRALSVGSALPRPNSVLLTPLVGRGTELRQLTALFEEASRERGRAALVCGEAGVGKTRLVRALSDQLEERTHASLECRSSPYARNTPFGTVIELLASSLDLGDDDRDARLQALRGRIAEAGLAVDEVLPPLAALLSLLPPEEVEELQLSPELRRRKTLEAVVAWTLSLARDEPMVLLVEDLHWADPSSLETLGMLIQSCGRSKLLIVLTARPEFNAPWPDSPSLHAITLERLTQPESCQLVLALVPGGVLPEGALDSIVERADGIPLYLEELTKGVIESGLLEQAGPRALGGDVSALAIPATLQDSLMARLDRLSAAKRVAQVAATIGRGFSYHLLQQVADMDEPTLRSALAQLVRAELVFCQGAPPAASYTFKHSLIQDTAYESLLRSARQPLHEKIARALERDTKAAPELLAHHYDRGGVPEAAIRYYQAAGEEARARGSNPEAIAQMRRGVELVSLLSEGSERSERELALQLGLGSTLHAAYGLGAEETHRAWERAHALSAQVGSPAQLGTALRGIMGFYDGLSQMDTAIELGKELLSLGHRTGDSAHLLAGYSGTGVARFWQGRFAECIKDLDAAIAVYEPARHARLAFDYGIDHMVEAHGFSAWSLWVIGLPDQSSTRVQAGVDHARALTHRYSLAYSLMLASALYAFRGEWDDCVGYARECIEVSGRQGFPLFRGISKAVIALERCSRTGEDTQALAADGLAEASGAGQRAGTPAIMWILARIHQELGQNDEAAGVVDAALAVSAEGRQHFFDAELLRLRGELVAPSNEKEGEALLMRSLELSREQGARSFELRTACCLARIWREQGRSDEARAFLSPIVTAFSEGAGTSDLGTAQALLAQLGSHT